MRRLNWIENVILPLAAAVFTAAWVEPWVRWGLRIGGNDRPFLLSPLMLVALMFAATLLARHLLITDYSIMHARALVAVISFFVIAGLNWLTFGSPSPAGYLSALINWGYSISPELVALIVTCFLWWRGLTMGSTEIPHDSLAAAFYNGLVAFTTLFIFNVIAPRLTLAEAIPPALIFFAVALGALALAGLEEDRRLQKKATGHWPGLNRRWLGTVIGVIGLIVIGGLIVGTIAAPDWILALVRPLVDALSLVALLIFSALAYIFIWPAMYLAAWLWEMLSYLQGLHLPRPPAGTSQTAEQLTEAILSNPIFISVGQSVTWFLLVALILWIFWAAARRLYLLSGGAGDDETRESILSRELLLSQLKSLFSSRQPQAESPPYLPLDGERGDPRLIIRRAYRAMLEWAKVNAQPRRPHQTPSAYADALSQAMPDHASAVAALTTAYVAARYAAEPPSIETARRAEAALVELQKPVTP